MITSDEALDLTQHLHAVLTSQLGGHRCRRAAAAAKTNARMDDDDLIQDTIARIVEKLEDRLPREELRAYARATLHNVAVDRARKGARAKRHIARYAEMIHGLTAPSGEHEMELVDFLEDRLTESEIVTATRLMLGERVRGSSKKQLREKLASLGTASSRMRESTQTYDLQLLALKLDALPKATHGVGMRKVVEALVSGMSKTEIVDQFGVSLNMVDQNIRRAMKIAAGESK